MNINQAIDHTALKPTTTQADIEQLCNEANQYQFKSVCVPPNFVATAANYLENSDVLVCTVIGFPLGYSATRTKVSEAVFAISQGAREIDMVIAIGKLKENDLAYVKQDIQAVYSACQQFDAVLKVIIETALLTDEEKIAVCEICASIGVDFVKTSTGFSTSGAKLEDIQLMRHHLPENIQIKASGGIKTKDFALALLNAGATRLGCSSSIQIVSE